MTSKSDSLGQNIAKALKIAKEKDQAALTEPGKEQQLDIVNLNTELVRRSSRHLCGGIVVNDIIGEVEITYVRHDDSTFLKLGDVNPDAIIRAEGLITFLPTHEFVVYENKAYRRVLIQTEAETEGMSLALWLECSITDAEKTEGSHVKLVTGSLNRLRGLRDSGEVAYSLRILDTVILFIGD